MGLHKLSRILSGLHTAGEHHHLPLHNRGGLSPLRSQGCSLVLTNYPGISWPAMIVPPWWLHLLYDATEACNKDRMQSDLAVYQRSEGAASCQLIFHDLLEPTCNGGADCEGPDGVVCDVLGPLEDLHRCFGAPVGECAQAGLDRNIPPRIQQEDGVPVQDAHVSNEHSPTPLCVFAPFRLIRTLPYCSTALKSGLVFTGTDMHSAGCKSTMRNLSTTNSHLLSVSAPAFALVFL